MRILQSSCGVLVLVLNPLWAPAQVPAGRDTLGAGFLYTTIAGVHAPPALNYDFSVSTYQLLTTNLRFDERNERQKVNFAPFKLRRDILACSSICELTLNLVRSKDGFTMGVAHAFNPTAPYTQRARDAATAMGKQETMRPRNQNESEEQYAQYRRLYYVKLEEMVEEYANDLVKKAVILTYGFNIQIFPQIGGTDVDFDSNGLIDNAHAVRSYNLNGGIAYSPSHKASVTGTYFYTKKRASSVEGKQLQAYHSFALSFGWRAAVLDPQYRASEAYKKKGFIPAIVVGGLFEGMWCRSEAANCDDQTTRSIAATPFIDVKLTSEAQFRLGIPLKWNRTAGKELTEVQPLFQFGLLLASL